MILILLICLMPSLLDLLQLKINSLIPLCPLILLMCLCIFDCEFPMYLLLAIVLLFLTSTILLLLLILLLYLLKYSVNNFTAFTNFSDFSVSLWPCVTTFSDISSSTNFSGIPYFPYITDYVSVSSKRLCC